MIKNVADGAQKLPTKLTEIYSMTVKSFFFKHNRQDKYSRSKTGLGTYMYKKFDQLKLENKTVFKKLGKIALNGIKEGRPIFGSNEVDGRAGGLWIVSSIQALREMPSPT